MEKLIKRLEILMNYIQLEEIEDIKTEVEKLKQFSEDVEIASIISDLNNAVYARATTKINNFINSHKQLNKWIDPDMAALKLELSHLESDLTLLSNEKSELEKLLSDFHNRHTVELGDIISEILKLRMEKFKNEPPKYEEAKNDYESYKEQIKTEKEKPRFELNEEEKLELKRKFRKAAIICHPDKVSAENKDRAEKIFIDLQQAYETNNLQRVNAILDNLEQGNFFQSISDTISEKTKLRAAIKDITSQISNIKTEISEIKESEAYKTIILAGDNWDSYFANLKDKLSLELEHLKQTVV
jgi:hypothetical protein